MASSFLHFIASNQSNVFNIEQHDGSFVIMFQGRSDRKLLVMPQTRAVDKLLRQQSALADFGTFALREGELAAILTEAVRICADVLGVPFAKICRYRAKENDLLIVAGFGWNAGVVGKVVSRADTSSTQGRAFVSGEPVILEDIAESKGYALPPFYALHGIVSTAAVLIKSKTGSWGVLEVDSAEPLQFDHHDIVFLTGFANVLAGAVNAVERSASVKEALRRLKTTVLEKETLLLERKVHEREFRELQTELLHVSRLNAMGQMTAAIAHELSQPLASISNYASAARRMLDSNDARVETIAMARELLDKTQAQALRAGDIIKNLRAIMEKRDSRKVVEDIGIVVKESMAVVTFGAPDSDIAIELDIVPDLPAVLIDKIQVQQILVNLVRNAMEAMLEVDPRKLTVKTRLGEPGFVDVVVEDIGPGLAPDIASHLFEPFVTTKNTGMGLGLMICQTLAEANGGRLWWQEHSGPGTAFCFCLPVAGAAGSQSQTLQLAS